MMPPTSIDGTDITGATIDGTDVQEITVDGQTVFSAGLTELTLDGFESGSLTAYNANNTSMSTVTSPALTGSRSLEFTSAGGGPSFVFSNDASIPRPQQGQKFAVKLRTDDSAGSQYPLGFGFGAISETGTAAGVPEGIFIEINSNDDRGEGEGLHIFEDPFGTSLDFDSFNPIEDNQIYRIEIKWETNNDVTAEIFEDGSTSRKARVQATVNAYTSQGGVFYLNGLSGGSTFYADNGSVQVL